MMIDFDPNNTLVKEADATVVAALDQVQGDVGEAKPGRRGTAEAHTRATT
jgi:hypothetical protein